MQPGDTTRGPRSVLPGGVGRARAGHPQHQECPRGDQTDPGLPADRVLRRLSAVTLTAEAWDRRARICGVCLSGV